MPGVSHPAVFPLFAAVALRILLVPASRAQVRNITIAKALMSATRISRFVVARLSPILRVSILVSMLWSASTVESLAQIQNVMVFKFNDYVQTASNQIAASSYGFKAAVQGQGLQGMAPPTLSGPINLALLGLAPNAGAMSYSPAGTGWVFAPPGGEAWGFGSPADRDAAFGSGTYTITVNGTTLPFDLSGDAYPNAPRVTLGGGNWVGGKYVLDPSRPLTVTTDPFVGYSAHLNGLIEVGWGQPYFHEYVRQWANPTAPPNYMTVTIPANTFASGQQYVLRTIFTSWVDTPTPLPGTSAGAFYQALSAITISAQAQAAATPAPVFPMTVTTNITPTTSSATANIQYRPQDVGSSGSVYSFAVAPQPLVKSAPADEAPFVVGKSKSTSGEKDTPVACVLAQLDASGQLRGVSSSNIQAYVTGVFSSQGQAVDVINGVATADISGATFYVGYGTSSTAMLNSGINRSVVTIPGSQICQPGPPQTGWWWNAAEVGRGYTIESAGSKLFFAAYLYDISGRSTWYIAAGPTSLDGSLFLGDLESYSNGQTLTGPFRSPVRPPVLNGKLTLAFSDSTHGTLTWPGGTVPITRMEFGVGGVNAVPQAGQPENGWWLSGLDDGRGFFIEWQAGVAFMAGFMYDDTGAPVWYIAAKPRTDNPQVFSSQWEKYVNGQTLTGAYRPPDRPPTYVGAATIQFQGAETAIMTMPGGRQVNLSRYRF